MRVLLSLCGFLPCGLLLSAAATAQEADRADRSLELNATAGPACVVGTPRALASANASFQAGGSTGGQITLTRLVDPDNALPRSARVDLAIPAKCNASHRVSARTLSGGLRRAGAIAGQGGQAGGFAEFLAYSVQLNWAGSQVEQRSDAGVLVIPVANAAGGDLALRVITPEGGTPLIAGRYDDTIVIQLQPAD